MCYTITKYSLWTKFILQRFLWATSVTNCLPVYLNQIYKKNKANLRDLIAVTGLVILRRLDSNNWFFILYDLEIRWITSKTKCTSSRSHQALCIISKPSVNSNWGNNPEMLNSGQNGQFFVMCDLEIWQMTLKTTGHLLYAIASFVHHFIAVSQFKL